MLNSELNVQVCDARDNDSSNKARLIKYFLILDFKI
jgi:hypothetical protein